MKLPLLTLLLTGCTVLDYSAPTGEHFHRSAFGNKTQIAVLTVETGSNGLKQVTLRGYNNDQIEALGVIAEGVAKGTAAGLK